MTSVNPNVKKPEYTELLTQISECNRKVNEYNSTLMNFRVQDLTISETAVQIKDKIINKQVVDAKTNIDSELKELDSLRTKAQSTNSERMEIIQKLNETYNKLNELKDKQIQILGSAAPAAPAKPKKAAPTPAKVEEIPDEEETED